MTKIYIYCLFDEDDTFHGVYSSLKAVHRDALKIANSSSSPVYMEAPQGMLQPSLKTLRNTLKGVCDVIVKYRSGRRVAKILKTKIKE
tara:strand:- start:887 stop:1150 length:264 start_codon:yes stop_codon:yes gene_type:complete